MKIFIDWCKSLLIDMTQNLCYAKSLLIEANLYWLANSSMYIKCTESSRQIIPLYFDKLKFLLCKNNYTDCNKKLTQTA